MKMLKKLIFPIITLFSVLMLTSCSDPGSSGIQKEAEEYIVYFIENAGYYAPTTAKVLKAGYGSAEGGDEYANAFSVDGIFYLTVQANTKGGGQTSNDMVILHGGEHDKEMMTNSDPGNDCSLCDQELDVAGLNKALGR